MPTPLNANAFNAWNPDFSFDVIGGKISDAEMRKRTLRFTFTSNAREYDQIEWELVNNDGKLTQLDNMALGLLVRVRFGYSDNKSGYHTFIISRMKGGVGVFGVKNAAVSETDARITLTGRNRNAPNIKGRRGKKTKCDPKASGTGKGCRRRSRGVSSRAVTRFNNAQSLDGYNSPTEDERIFPVTRLSDAVREVAYRMGYANTSIFIQDTTDQVNSIVIPTGLPYSVWLEKMASIWKWEFEAKKEFHFHERRWRENKKKDKLTLVYGGPDVLDLRLDSDFRLPSPRFVSVKVHRPTHRKVFGSVADPDNSAVTSTSLMLNINDTRKRVSGKVSRDHNLFRAEFFAAPGGGQSLAFEKAQSSFVSKQMRALQLQVRIVGNPHLLSRDVIKVKGTGCQLVDREWYIEQAKHVFDGTTYVTELALRPPTRRRKGGRLVAAKARGRQKSRDGAVVGSFVEVNVNVRRARFEAFKKRMADRGLANLQISELGGRL